MIRSKRARKGRGVAGTVRADHRTQNLLHRIQSGEIALIDHADLGQEAAEALVERRVIAVLDAADSITGSTPNAGPTVLLKAGVPLVDRLGTASFTALSEGDTIEVRLDGGIERDGIEVLAGRVVDQTVIDDAMRRANRNISSVLETFMRSTVDHLERERELLLLGEGLPELRTPLAGRHVVVVAKGKGYRADLERLRRYRREHRPVIFAVDQVVDPLIEMGVTPDVIVGDMDLVSSQALMSGAELIVHSYPDGSAPGLERVRSLGLEAVQIATLGTSADVALLLAYEHGADLIVSVGAGDSLAELVDKGRSGNASTFLVRLKVGPRLLDADGVSRLYRSAVRTRDLVLLVASSTAAVVAAAMVLPGPRLFLRESAERVLDLVRGVIG